VRVGFGPSRARGEALDRAVRRRLSHSLSALCGAVEGELSCDVPALRAIAAATEAHPVRPAVPAAYAVCVPLLHGDDVAAAEAGLALLTAPGLRQPATPRVTTLTDAELGPGMAGCYRLALSDEGDVPFEPLDAGELPGAMRRVEEALALLGPGFAGEIGAVAHEVVAVSVPAGSELVFHGGSSFFLWGGIMLNLAAHPTRVKLAEGLAHESGHAVLFGMTMGAPLVLNPPDERHPSPLRHDPRPMDGIVHATWVLARMHLAMETLLAQGGLAAAEREEARAALARIRRDFADGLAVTDAHARFTPDGARAFDLARGYMAGQPAGS
jgi:HEXXH motif-containing protein